MATTLVVQRQARAAWERMRGRRAVRLGQRSEREAERLLKRQGYRIEARQVTAQWAMVVDGSTQTVTCRADLLVSRHRRRYVAEVKAGATRAPTAAPVRRQLLEYLRTFDVDGVLLVDMTEGVVHTVIFPEQGTKR